MSTSKYATYKTQLKQGADWNFTFYTKDNNRNVLPLTGYSAYAQFRTTAGGKVLLDASTVNTLITIDGSAGEVNIQLSHSHTESLPAGTVYADIFLVSSTGTRNSPIILEVEVLPRYTEIVL